MFPIKNFKYDIPTENDSGGFGYVRKFDIHTGVDLYCSKNDPVYSITNGIVIDIIEFTGFDESPWWNDTWAIIVYHPKIGTVVYGELYYNDRLEIGQIVKEGDIIGNVSTVLKTDKGKNPMNMLHFELYDGIYLNPVIWELNEEIPEKLKNPTELLSYLKISGLSGS